MDPDYSVFALLPPYNTIRAQLIDEQGRLVDNPIAVTVTYEAIADPDGSISTQSADRSNFWTHAQDLFGVALPPDVGLAGTAMPGPANQPQPMMFDVAHGWFEAAGIPITPIDDAGGKNTYPLFRLVARADDGSVLATTDIVLPVSDELNCKTCHTSGTSPGAQPAEGWVFDPDPERDVRLNILRLHDDREAGSAVFQQALLTTGYDSAGLYATAVGGKAVLCARCHLSEALPGSGIGGISPLTQAIHRRMANVLDPITGLLLDSVDNRAACYRCHPGTVTRCLRGAMGSAVAPDGTLAMQCQSCHGSMLAVASTERRGWLDEPACQSCHTGTAVNNSGAIRYDSVFTPEGAIRQAVDGTFATTPDTPASGLSLYQFSRGHGGLYCEACHGPTHAEFPSAERNDNIQSIQHQGHAGMLVECTACHASTPDTVTGGPHGLHPVGASWVERHGSVAEDGGASACRTCHGLDYRGSVLSRAQADRTFDTDFGRKHFWRGFQVGCYTCHRGPNDENRNPNRAPTVMSAALTVHAGTPATLTLEAQDADGDPLALRIVSQPQHGTVALDGQQATVFADADFIGADRFTFAASDGSTDSELGTITLAIATAASPTPTMTPAATPLPCACAGDCDRNETVTIDELIRGVRIALEADVVAQCSCSDLDRNGRVTVDELVVAVNRALHGCG